MTPSPALLRASGPAQQPSTPHPLSDGPYRWPSTRQLYRSFHRTVPSPPRQNGEKNAGAILAVPAASSSGQTGRQTFQTKRRSALNYAGEERRFSLGRRRSCSAATEGGRVSALCFGSFLLHWPGRNQPKPSKTVERESLRGAEGGEWGNPGRGERRARKGDIQEGGGGRRKASGRAAAASQKRGALPRSAPSTNQKNTKAGEGSVKAPALPADWRSLRSAFSPKRASSCGSFSGLSPWPPPPTFPRSFFTVSFNIERTQPAAGESGDFLVGKGTKKVHKVPRAR